jgi:hypothetical protein
VSRRERVRRKRQFTRQERDQEMSVLQVLDCVIRDGGRTSNPIEEQLSICPGAFKVGELVGKMCDSLKHGRECGERLLPPPGLVLPPFI